MKKQMKPFLLMILSYFFVLGFSEDSMAGTQKKTRQTMIPESTQAIERENALEENWELIEMDGEAVSDIFPDKHPTIEFKIKEKQISGFAGCNQYHGQLILDDKYLKIVGVVATKMACPVLDEEEEFLAILQEVEQYSIAENELSLWSGGQLLLKFKKAD